MCSCVGKPVCSRQRDHARALYNAASNPADVFEADDILLRDCTTRAKSGTLLYMPIGARYVDECPV